MRLFIQKNIKKIVVLAFVLALGLAFVSAEEILAKLMPSASELQMIYCELDQMRHEYTGTPIEPEIIEVAFQDKNGDTVLKLSEEITVTKYIDNTEHGAASIEVSINGYADTIVLEDVFYIHPAKAGNPNVEQSSMEAVDLKWDEMAGVSGYYVYKSIGTEEHYTLVCQIEDGKVTTYQDTELDYNCIYYYKVGAYYKEADKTLDGQVSDSIKHYTPLSTPVLTEVVAQDFDSISITWETVAGAAGYQVYKSDSENGEYQCIAEIQDGTVINYIDNSCECGKPFFYYIKACQKLETESIYGDSSNILSGKTTPDAVRLSGSVSDGNTQVSLSWKKSSGAQGYEIYRCEASNGNYKLVKKIESADTLSWTDTGLSKDVEYRYRIRPYCVSAGTTITGDYSNSYLKEVVIVFNYTPGEVSENIAKVLSFQGTPYVWGGKTSAGWDCSGFTSWTMKNCFGVSIPLSASGQGYSGQAVSLSDRSSWKQGDILAYSDGSRITHVAMYIGNGQLIHALNEKYDTFVQGVDYYESWDTGNRLVAVRRYF